MRARRDDPDLGRRDDVAVVVEGHDRLDDDPGLAGRGGVAERAAPDVARREAPRRRRGRARLRGMTSRVAALRAVLTGRAFKHQAMTPDRFGPDTRCRARSLIKHEVLNSLRDVLLPNWFFELAVRY